MDQNQIATSALCVVMCAGAVCIPADADKTCSVRGSPPPCSETSTGKQFAVSLRCHSSSALMPSHTHTKTTLSFFLLHTHTHTHATVSASAEGTSVAGLSVYSHGSSRCRLNHTFTWLCAVEWPLGGDSETHRLVLVLGSAGLGPAVEERQEVNLFSPDALSSP